MEALLMVDLQKAFPPPRALVERVRRYSRRFRRRIFTRFVNRKSSLFRTKLKQQCCAPGTSDLEMLIAPEKK
jgi:nicotinamidase-related amidase